MISEVKNNESVDMGGDQVRTTFRNLAAPEQFGFDEEQWAGHPLPVILTAYREAYSQTIYQVAESLRIRAVYIQYLESGQYSELPGDTYAIGFIRTYATYLGLPVDKMVERYKAETGSAIATQKMSATPRDAAPSEISILPKVAMAVSGITLVAILFMSWFYFSARDDQSSTPVASLSEKMLNMLNSDGATSEESASAPANSTGDTLFSDSPIVIDGSSEQSNLNTTTEVSAVQAVSVQTDDNQDSLTNDQVAALTPLPTAAELNPAPASRVVIQANQLSWMQVRKPGDEILISKVMQPGETQEIPNSTGLRLLTGSVDGLKITVDGQAVAPTGPNDGYSVDISLNPDELLAMAN